MKKKKGTRSR